MVRGVSWRDIGVHFPKRWPVLVLEGLAAGILIEAQELYVTQPLLIKLIWPP
jgi:hypothetical protein